MSNVTNGKEARFHPASAPGKRRVVATFLGALLVGVLGFAIGMAANTLPPKRLTLSRDYFHPPPRPSPAAAKIAKSLGGQSPLSTNASAANRLEAGSAVPG